ncbi:MAG: ATP-binding cassette domain-containing protein [Isosphaeraceae bacterium]
MGPSGSGKSTIMRLPLGFEAPDAGTVTYDGRELSTLDLREVRHPRILMFDEATSALDNLTQAIVTESITRELRGITRVVIAHRLTTGIDADRIDVVKKGQIVQSGEYHQLPAEPGPFQEPVHRQSA